ncbi:MAG: hypothetical protein LBI99_01300, partial [Propionibacteriaceae bacterium]|jgi:peptide/nickel transport system permease protein|nr:hypothetical protein [Propionibacteriaceae bacterium]
MYAGQVVETADIETLYHSPRHPYTRALIAANPAGAIRGELLPSIPGQVPDPSSWPAGCHFAPRCALARPQCEQAPVPLGWDQEGRANRCVLVGAPVVSGQLDAGGPPEVDGPPAMAQREAEMGATS